MLKKRVTAMLTGLAVLFAGVAVRVGYLTQGDLSTAADRQASYTLTVATARGTIYDTNMDPLTNTGSEYRVSVVPTPETLAALSAQLEPEKWESAEQRLSGGAPIALVMDSAPSTVAGMMAFQVPVRYTDTLPAEHLLGYLDSEGQGVTGVEQLFDDVLSEYSGEVRVTYTLDGTGEWLQGVTPEVENTLSRSQGGIALTLDSGVQKIAQRAADRYLPQGAALVCEADTGRVLSMVSTPGFQPDRVADVLNDTRSPLLNRTLCNYNCGSVFKIVTAAAALEGGIPLTTTYSCTGRIEVQGVGFRCHQQLGHGQVNMVSGFAGSCNPYFIQLAQRTGGERLYRMASLLGFNRSLAMEGGLETARAVLPQRPSLNGAALANLSIGQGELLATPLHIAALVGAVVNDGAWRMPSILKGMVDEYGKLTETGLPEPQTAFSPATAATLRDMMLQTVRAGTGEAAKPATGEAAGKTGTAETGWRQEGAEEVVQSWFAGFYPADDPDYVIVTLAEDADNTGGNSAAAFRQICEQLASL